MKVTMRQLRRIIRESFHEAPPRMSGIMDPEPPEVMADIEHRRNMGLEEKVQEWYAQEISDLAMIIHYENLERDEALQALADHPLADVSRITPDEMDIIWDLALLESEEI